MFAVVMAGGAGTRLWPAGRARCPKQFLNLMGEGSPLQRMLSRLREELPPERIAVVANVSHTDLVAAALPPGARAVHEPAARGTGPCLGLAALHLASVDPEAVVVALPADNWIELGQRFDRAIQAAARLARTGAMVVIGTTPSGPAIGFGYIRPGERIEAAPGSPPAFRLGAFTEKPGAERAARLCAEGWLWNAGIFAFRPTLLLEEIGRLQPGLAAALARVGKAMGTAAYEAVLADSWHRLPAISIEDGLLSRGVQSAAVVHADFAWSDLGTWDAVRADALGRDGENAVRGDALVWRSSGCLVRAGGGRFVALLGVEDLTVVDTPDALLVLGPGHGQAVREVVDYLHRCRPELL